MKYVERQPKCWLSQPPSDGPAGRADPVGGRHHHLPAHAGTRIGKEIGDRRERRADHHPAADALQASREHQKRHAARDAAQHRRHREHDHGRDHETLAAEVVAEAPEHGHRHDGCEQIGARDPRVVLEAVQFDDDRRQCRADHRLIERDEHVDETDAEHRQQRVTERQHLHGAGVRR
jgi:hypothetical protein